MTTPDTDTFLEAICRAVASDDLRTIQDWLLGSASSGRTLTTQRNYRRALGRWIAFIDARLSPLDRDGERALLWRADGASVRAWQAALRSEDLQPSTVNYLLAAVSSFYEFALVERRTPEWFRENHFRKRVRRDVIYPYSRVRALSVEEYDRLLTYLEAHSDTLEGARTHALIRTFLNTGWRAGELMPMRAGDLEAARGTSGLMRYRCARPHGRGFVDVLPADCLHAIQTYLALAGRPLEDMPPDAYIWTPVTQPVVDGLGVKLDMESHICVKTAQRVVRTALRQAGIKDANTFRLHDLRHTHAFLLHEGGSSIDSIAKRMRYSHKQSLVRYLRGIFAEDDRDEHSDLFAALRGSHK